MDNALLTAAAGMRAQIESLELLGNNISNAETTGYKRDHEFFRLFLSAQAEPDPRLGQLPWMPVVEGSRIDYAQGPLRRTEAPLDLALSGPGFFEVESPGGRLYTRNGSFRLDSGGDLVTSQGYRVLDVAGRALTLPSEGRIDVSENGLVSIEGLAVARLSVVEFDGRPPLRKAGDSFFAAPPDVNPQPAVESVVHQGSVESSNVNVPQSAVELIATTRNFEMLSRVVRLIGDEMNGRAVEDLGRTS